MSSDLRCELDYAYDAAPYVSDPYDIPNLINSYVNEYTKQIHICEEGETNLYMCRKIIFIVLTLIFFVACHFVFTAERGSGILVMKKFAPYWIISFITGIIIYAIMKTTTTLRKREAKRARESLISLVGLYYKNEDRIEKDYQEAWRQKHILKNAISTLDKAI